MDSRCSWNHCRPHGRSVGGAEGEAGLASGSALASLDSRLSCGSHVQQASTSDPSSSEAAAGSRSSACRGQRSRTAAQHSSSSSSQASGGGRGLPLLSAAAVWAFDSTAGSLALGSGLSAESSSGLRSLSVCGSLASALSTQQQAIPSLSLEGGWGAQYHILYPMHGSIQCYITA